MSVFQPGDLIGGRYRLMRVIGAGAMGTVWAARNESTDRDFALKLMLPDAAKNPVALQRFFQEAKASGRLRHRCIVEVYDLGRMEAIHPNDSRAGTPYLVMELLEGEPLDSLLRRRKKLATGTAIQLIRDVARALDVAHKQRIVHRDLKPANIYLHKTLEGTIVPKILDFGISKLVGPTNFDAVATSIGTVLGSPAYMSPEQAAGETDVDGRSDVWSLGVILYKCLCGTVPFSAANYNALMMAIARTAHSPLRERIEGLPEAIDTIVDKCLSKEREGRLESAKMLADELDKILTDNPALGREDLMEIVMAPVELPPDEARTIATAANEPAGTLAATELSGPEPPPSQPAATAAHATSSETREIRDSVAPQFRNKRAPIVAGALGAMAILVTVLLLSRRAPEPTPSTGAPQPVQTEAPRPTTEPMVLLPPPPPAVAPAPPTPSAAPSPSATVASKPHVVPKNPVKTVKPQTTAKPAHEGVTSSGI